MTARNGEKRIHVRWISEGVNGNDCSGFVRDRLFGPLWIHVESDGINVDKDGICSHIANRVGDSDEGEGRYNDFVPRSYTESKHAKVEARSSGAYADGVGNTRVSGNGVLEFFELWAQAQTCTAQHLHDSFYFCRRYVRRGERNLHGDQSGLDVRFRSRSAPRGTEVNISTILSAACPSP